MHFGINIKPVIDYLHQHPHTAFIVAFLVAFLESLPVIGTVIPGSITMTAMGTMIGSTVLPAYTTFGWAILGALCGDTVSYLIGYRYYATLRNVWPLKKYPKLFSYGEAFFKKHGGKSILIGRFVGPMRSAIPLVAGILQMGKTRFFSSAFPSAVLWALAYMLPGVLIGAISQEMPHGKSTEFIVGFFAILIFFWLFMWLIKRFIVFIMRTVNYALRNTWEWLKRNHNTRGISNWLQQYDTPHEHRPLNYILLSLFAWILFFIFLHNTITHGRFTHWNKPVFYLLQSLHTQGLSIFFAWITNLAALPVILTSASLIWIWFMLQNYRRTAWYWLSMVIVTAGLVSIFKFLFYAPRPGGLSHYMSSSSFPSGHTTLAMGLYGFLTYLFTHRIRARIWHGLHYTTALFLISLVGLSRLYFGAHWLSDVAGGLSLGAAILFLVVVLYRRFPCEKIPARRLTYVVLLSVIIPWIIYNAFTFRKIINTFKPVWPQHNISQTSWWQHPTRHLPLYRLSRIGLPSQPFNLQWVGSISTIDNILKQHQWKRYKHEEKLKSMVERLITLNPSKHMPLLPPLFHNQPPVAVFIKSLTKDKLILELRLWDSGSKLTQVAGKPNLKLPIWLGNISYHRAGKKIIAVHAKDRSHYKVSNALDFINIPSSKIHTKTIDIPLTYLPNKIAQQQWDGRIILLDSHDTHS